MVKIYCDRCNKELIKHKDNPWHNELVEAANGDDIFFTVSAHDKVAPSNLYPTESDDNVHFNGSYIYRSPDLCQECMRIINDAIKTVWDGKELNLVRDLSWICDVAKKNS